MVLWKDMAVHDQTSVKLSEKCKVCGELVRPDEMARRRRDAAELHVQYREHCRPGFVHCREHCRLKHTRRKRPWG